MSILFFPLSLANAQYDPWVNVNNGLVVEQAILATNGETLLVGSDWGLYSSINNGDSWEKIWEDFSMGTNNTLLARNNNIWIGRGMIILSTNNGENWSLVPIKPDYYPTVAIIFIRANENHIFAATHDDGVYTSTDNGFNWTKTNFPVNDVEIGSMAVSGNNIYVGTILPYNLWISNDNGVTWRLGNSPTNTAIHSLIADGNDIFAGTHFDGVYLSTDSCSTWTKTSLPDFYVSWMGISGEYLLLVADNKTFVNFLCLSTDRGSSWKQIKLPRPRVTDFIVKDDYVFISANRGDHYGDHYKDIFRAKISDLITDIQDDAPSSEISIYPNPASDYIYINSPLVVGAGGIYEYTIIDLLGQNVQRSVLTDSKIDISKIPTGAYCIVFSNGGKQIIQKFIKY
jgi:hypothetical protein